ncbi:MAG TPA: aldo/keto reductase [Anaerolineae bacterium]|nr:aldo/keto reductase [Anaerolineae bacterium]HQI85212.1 aldo/keto reductase [Anaerolineae bacterium]
MKTYHIACTDLTVSRLAYGCMKIGGSWGPEPLTQADKAAAVKAVVAAYEQGITLFDHADIYTRGKSEEAFAAVWPIIPRDKIIVQSKCGIRFAGDPYPGAPHRFDFSYEHIVASVEGSLRRLRTDYLDILLLHRPDALMEPEEVARAFDDLAAAGKVRYFGVSNHTAAQMALLRIHADQPIVINQVQLSLLHHYLISEGVIANIAGKPAVYGEPGRTALATATLDFCRAHGILVQAWGPVAGGQILNPPADAAPHVKATAALVAQMAQEKGTTPEAIALAWLLRHPAGIQPIIGTTKPERIAASCLADDVTLTREEWYALFTAGRGEPLP